MNKIYLKINPELKVLAGKPFGRAIYKEQLKNCFTVGELNEIIFPETIRIICSSFVFGLFENLLKKHSAESILKSIFIENSILYKHIKQGLTIYE